MDATDDTEPRRIYLHIGLHKTGTTYLQHLLRNNREHLDAQGVLFPGGDDQPPQVFAVWDLLGRRPRGTRDARITGAWQALVDTVQASHHPTVLVSEEHLSTATSRQARAAVTAFPGREVHVVVTARDLGRVLASAWQESVKVRDELSWPEFAAAVRDPARAGSEPARGFWARQDLPGILATWSRLVPEERIHVVTVPASGASPDVLVQRVGSVVGFAPTRLPEQPAWVNETLGPPGTELIRRLNPLLADLNHRQYDKAVRQTLVRLLVASKQPVPVALAASDAAWARDRAQEMITAVRGRGYEVVGNLADLEVPTSTAGRHPGECSDAELVEQALAALSGLTRRYVTAWWANKGPDEAVKASPVTKGTSAARVAVGRSRSAVGAAADRYPALGRLVASSRRRSRG